MNFDRTDRISEEVRREIDRIIREEVRDPRVCGTWSITRAEVTRDLRYAKVRVSVLEEEQRKPLLAALKSASGIHSPPAWQRAAPALYSRASF